MRSGVLFNLSSRYIFVLTLSMVEFVSSSNCNASILSLTRCGNLGFCEKKNSKTHEKICFLKTLLLNILIENQLVKSVSSQFPVYCDRFHYNNHSIHGWLVGKTHRSVCLTMSMIYYPLFRQALPAHLQVAFASDPTLRKGSAVFAHLMERNAASFGLSWLPSIYV